MFIIMHFDAIKSSIFTKIEEFLLDHRNFSKCFAPVSPKMSHSRPKVAPYLVGCLPIQALIKILMIISLLMIITKPIQLLACKKIFHIFFQVSFKLDKTLENDLFLGKISNFGSSKFLRKFLVILKHSKFAIFSDSCNIAKSSNIAFTNLLKEFGIY